jgi:hypothetical protein
MSFKIKLIRTLKSENISLAFRRIDLTATLDSITNQCLITLPTAKKLKNRYISPSDSTAL